MGFVIKVQHATGFSRPWVYVGAVEISATHFENQIYERLSDAAVYAYSSLEVAAAVILSLQLKAPNSRYSIVDVGNGLGLPDDYDDGEAHTLKSENWREFVESRGIPVRMAS